MAAGAYSIFSLPSTYYYGRYCSRPPPLMLKLLHFSSSKLATNSVVRRLIPLPLSCRALNDDSHQHETLERDLQLAIQLEDYGLAAKIRDQLRILHLDSTTEVLAANARFYNAFKTGDLTAMQHLWSQGEHVCCVHPGVNRISGYDLVITSWEYVLANYEFPLEIKVEDIVVHVKGELGFVTCIEFIKTKGGSTWGKQSVTNVFERIGAQWFLCVHHASTSNFDK